MTNAFLLRDKPQIKKTSTSLLLSASKIRINLFVQCRVQFQRIVVKIRNAFLHSILYSSLNMSSIRIKRDESHLYCWRAKRRPLMDIIATIVIQNSGDNFAVWWREEISSLFTFSLSIYLLSQRRSSGGIILWKITGNKTERARRPWDSAGKHLCGYIPEQPDLIDSLTPVFKKRSSLDLRINKPRKRRQQARYRPYAREFTDTFHWDSRSPVNLIRRDVTASPTRSLN